MNRSFYRLVLTVILPLFYPAVLITPAAGQSQEVMVQGGGQKVRVCESADLDSNVSFFRAETYFIVAFNMRNISESPCVPRPGIGDPVFDSAQGPQTGPFGLCMDCEDRLPNGGRRFHWPLVLSPGEVAHQTFRWSTMAPTGTVKCLQLSWLRGLVLIDTPTLLKPVCSEIAVSRIYAGAFVPPTPEGQAPAAEAQPAEMFVLSSSKPSYYQGDRFALHVGLANPGSEPPSGEGRPTLFLRERSPDGNARLDEVQPGVFNACGALPFRPLSQIRNADWQSGFEVDAGDGSRWTGIGDHMFELFVPVDPSRGGEIQFVHSNKLTVKIDDLALIARTWAGKAKGVAVDVTLDKRTYQLGEDVPLHIALENFDAPVPIYAISPVWDPGEAIEIEVSDSTGHLLPESERCSNGIIWTGHGAGPFLFPPGKLVPIERTLGGQAWLPNRPGVYTVVVTWHTLEKPSKTHLEPGSGPPREDAFKAYATVQASATFRIVGPSSPATHSQP